MKAARESAYPEIRRLRREIWIEPSIEDLHSFYAKHICPAQQIAFDIETAYEQITCVGFASSSRAALVIPFVDTRKPAGNYWPTAQQELEAWKFVAKVLRSPKPKVGQNGLYDIQYLWQKYGIPVNGYVDDTMLLHHSLLPESDKGLAFLGSVYTDEAAWKLNRPKGKHMVKPEDEE
jgi:DNA polymerase I-like protein with 3'-5' exonuclease and polymerase domains